MLLVEQHNLKGKYKIEADSLCFKSKNLYNLALYTVRQFYLEHDSYLNFYQMDSMLKGYETYKALPAKISQQVLLQLHNSFKAFFEALKSWQKHPEVFTGKPKMPGYKDKQKGRNLVVYTSQAISKRIMKKLGVAQLSKSNIALSTLKKNIQQIRIVPTSTGGYVAEIVFNQEPEPVATLDKTKHLAIDLGLNNLVAMTSDQKDFQPLLVSGGGVKAINQWYNKKKAEKQEQLNPEAKSSKGIRKLTAKRNRKIKHLFHQVSKFVVATAVKHNLGTIVIGYNKEWKQRINIGKVNNQNFVAVPFQMLIDQVSYKAELVGIQVELQEESYTSKCSALDYETIEFHEGYEGVRTKRGLYRAGRGSRLLNADINGSCNILRKYKNKKGFQNTFDSNIKTDWIEAIVVAPKRMVFQA